MGLKPFADPFQEIVWTPVPPFETTLIAPSHNPSQVGLKGITVGAGKLGGPGTTNTVSGPKLVPALQLDQPALQIICQKVIGTGRPDPDEWKIIDFTSQISATTVNGYLTVDSLTGTTFTITEENYAAADDYNLNDFIPLVSGNTTTPSLNFGDEYYFYGSLETDIEAKPNRLVIFEAGKYPHRVTNVTRGTRYAIAINLWETMPSGVDNGEIILE